MKLLVIEHEQKTATHLRRGLSQHGFLVDLSRDRQEGFRLATDRRYDLLIVDAEVPRRNDWSFLANLKLAGSPVLFVSPLGAAPGKIGGLRLESDYCLAKPFAFSELLARIQSILRRVPLHQPEVVSIADLQVDLFSHRATRQGKRLDLTPREFHLLAMLARRPGIVVSRTIIAEQLWGTDFDGDENLLDARVRRLRTKVDDPFEKPLIHTVRRWGYVLEDPPAHSETVPFVQR